MSSFIFRWTADNQTEFQNKITTDLGSGLINQDRADILSAAHGLMKLAYLKGLPADNIIILASDIDWTIGQETSFQALIQSELENAYSLENHSMISSLKQLVHANNIVKSFYLNNTYPFYVINRLLTTPVNATYLFLIGQDQARAFNALYEQYQDSQVIDNIGTNVDTSTVFDVDLAFNNALRIINTSQSRAFATGLITIHHALALCPDSTELSQAKAEALNIPGVSFLDLGNFTKSSQVEMLKWLYSNKGPGVSYIDANDMTIASQCTSQHNLDAFLTLLQIYSFLQTEDQDGNFIPIYPNINSTTTDSTGNNLISIIANAAFEYDYAEQVITLNIVFQSTISEINKIKLLNPDDLQSQIASLRAKIEPDSSLIQQINSMTPNYGDIANAIFLARQAYNKAVVNAAIIAFSSGQSAGVPNNITAEQINKAISAQVYSGFMGLVNKYLFVGDDLISAINHVNSLVNKGFAGRLYTIFDIVRKNDNSVAALTDGQRFQYLLNLSTTLLTKFNLIALDLVKQNYCNDLINSYIPDAKGILAYLVGQQQASGSVNIINAITQVNSLIEGIDNIEKIPEINSMLARNIDFSLVSSIANNQEYSVLRQINDILASGASFNDALSDLNIDIGLIGENTSG